MLIRFGKKISSKAIVLYSDKLVVLTESELVFAHYYLPFVGGTKFVPLADIQSLTVEPPTLRNGKWRVHGAGTLKMWFPRDFRRPQRDRIFFATLKTQRIKIGFTVEDGARFEAILRHRNLLKGT
jgi:hypothetical protein